MFKIEFYEKANGKSEVWDFLEKLRKKIPQVKMHGSNLIRLFSILICWQKMGPHYHQILLST